MLRGYCGKAKTKDLVLPLVQHVVKSAVILVCVCDLLPASARLCLLDKPSPLRSDRQIQSADTVRHPEHCTEVQAFTVEVVCFTGMSSQVKGDNHDLLHTVQNDVWHYVRQ